MSSEVDIERSADWLECMDTVPIPTLLRALWATSLVIGALHTVFTLHVITGDGLSYIDLGEAFWNGEWRSALGGYWSPLYAWMIGGVLKLVRPSPFTEYAVIHALNYVLFCASMACFHFFITKAYAYRISKSGPATTFPQWAWYVLGYSLFLWSGLGMMTIAHVTPEMLLSSFLYLAAGLLMCIRNGDDRFHNYAALGLLLGMGYLTKGYVLVLSAVFITVAVLLARNIRRGVAGGIIALLALSIVGGPYIAVLSQKMGRVTATDSGRFIYSWHINRKPWVHWQGPGATHPTRLLLESPAVYEFAQPIAGHYPPWFDPTYWLDGMKPEIDLKAQARMFVRYGWEIFQLLWDCGAIVAGIVFLYLYSGNGRSRLRRTLQQWFLFAPAIVPLVIFGSLNVEARYIAVAVLTLWVGLFLSVEIPPNRAGRNLAGACAIAIAFFLAGRLAYVTFLRAHEAMSGNVPAQTAMAIHSKGVPPNSDVAVISIANNFPWARPAQLRIISEIPFDHAPTLWSSPETTRQQVYAILRRTGAVAAIAPFVPLPCRKDGWQPAGNSGLWVLKLV